MFDKKMLVKLMQVVAVGLVGGTVLWANCKPEEPVGTLDEIQLGHLHEWPVPYESPWTPIPEARASAIKTWSTNEVLRSSDLNANFNHIHNTMVGGHGAVLVDADVASNAAIAHTKLATPSLVPKTWASQTAVCDGAVAGGACVTAEAGGSVAITGNGTAGQYRVNLNYSPPNASFAVLVTAITVDIYCVAHTFVATTGDANGTNFIIACKTDAGVATNSAFSFVLLDT